MGKSQNVLVYGGTGSQARPLVALLLERGHTPHVLTRNPAAAQDLQSIGAKLVVGDLADAASLTAASRGMDAIAFLVPAFVTDPQVALAYSRSALMAAREAGVKLVVWNTSAHLPRPDDPRFAGDVLFKIWAVIKESGLPWIVIAPTTYMENLLGPWTADSVRVSNTLTYPVLAERPMGWIASRDVGALIVRALESPELAGRAFRVSGVEKLTGPELASAFSDVLGRPIRYSVMTPQAMEAALDAAFGPGAGVEVARQYGRDQRDPNPPEKWYDMAPVLRELPVEMTSIRTWVRAHVSSFDEGRS